MNWYRAIIKDEIIAYNVKMADSFLKRLVGLLSKEKLYDDEGLLLKNCKQVHTFGMKFDIDVVFLTKDGRIVHTQPKMRPGEVSKYVKSADGVLELKSGTIQKYDIKQDELITFVTL